MPLDRNDSPLILLVDASTDHRFFLDNQQTSTHQSVIFGLRELTANETLTHCYHPSTSQTLPITQQPSPFTSDYELRLYTSGCYYLDANQQWQSDGLQVTLRRGIEEFVSICTVQVGPLTDFDRTQCFSTHLTTFAGGFLALPAPINWNYAVANADFTRNKTLYLTVILVLVLYLLLSIYARRQDKKDLERVGRRFLVLDLH